MDEPCSALDPTSTRRVEETIRAIANEVTVVIVTHNMQQAQRVSNRCAFFLASEGQPGHIVEQGPTEEIFERPQDERTARLRERSLRMTTGELAPPRVKPVVDAMGRRVLKSQPSASDVTFVAAMRSSAISTLIIMGLIGVFLFIGAWPAIHQQGWSFFTESQWLPEAGTFGIASLLWGTILVGLFALVVAVPLGFGAALFISEYAPRSIRRSLVSLVDLMAAVPSIIYAMWALFFLQAHLLSVVAVAVGALRRLAAVPAGRRAGLAVVVHLVGVHRRDRGRGGGPARPSPRSCERCSRRRRSVSGRARSPWAPRAGG